MKAFLTFRISLRIREDFNSLPHTHYLSLVVEGWTICTAIVIVTTIVVVVLIAIVTGRLLAWWLLLICRRLSCWRLSCLRAHWLSHSLVHSLTVVFHSLIKQEVGSVLLILIACEVGLSSLTLRETKALKSLNCLHFLCCDLDTTLWRHTSWRHLTVVLRLTSTSARHSTTLSTCHNQIHESHGVLLDFSVEFGLLLL